MADVQPISLHIIKPNPMFFVCGSNITFHKKCDIWYFNIIIFIYEQYSIHSYVKNPSGEEFSYLLSIHLTVQGLSYFDT